MRLVHPVRRVQARTAARRFAGAGGLRAADCSGTMNDAACVGLLQSGHSAVMRYLGRLSSGEANLIRASGLDIIGVLEHNGDGGYNGYAYGAKCMNDAIAGTRASGGPSSGIVLWIAEYDFDARDPGRAQGFIDGAWDTAHAAGYLSGHYGPWGLGKRTTHWDGWFQTMSTGFYENGYTTACTMTQHFPQPVYGGIQFDEIDIHDPTRAGLWHGTAPKPPPPPPFHPSGGQEDSSKVAIATRPAPGNRAIDAAVVGADGNVWGTWAIDPEHLASAAWENLGSPYGAKSVSLAWTQDAGQLVLTCHATDNTMWIKVYDTTFGWLSDGQWQKTAAVLAP